MQPERGGTCVRQTEWAFSSSSVRIHCVRVCLQDEGSGFAVAKEPGENVVCHRHASRVGAVTSAGSSAVEGVKSLKVEHVEGSFTNSSNEKLGRFKITSRGEGPLLNDKPA